MTVPGLKTRKPTGRVPYPCILLEGEEKSGKPLERASWSFECLHRLGWEPEEASAKQPSLIDGFLGGTSPGKFLCDVGGAELPAGSRHADRAFGTGGLPAEVSAGGAKDALTGRYP